MMNTGNEGVTEIPKFVLDLAKELVVGKINEFVGESIENGIGFAAESVEDQLATLFTVL